MKKEEINKSIIMLAELLTEVTGQKIQPENIHANAGGRFYYIQAPLEKAPMLLRHYRGCYFVDMHPNDYERLKYMPKDKVENYLKTANWQVGYFWGGGSMIHGGFYQPMDIVGRKDEVRRYLKILACRSDYRSSGYIPKEEQCQKCSVANCPFSKYKVGDWKDEIQENDPRLNFFKALQKRVKEEFGYNLGGITCSNEINGGQVRLRKMITFEGQEPAFEAGVSSGIIRAMLIKQLVPENWAEYAARSEIFVQKRENGEVVPATQAVVDSEASKCILGKYSKKDATCVAELEQQEATLAAKLKKAARKFFKR